MSRIGRIYPFHAAEFGMCHSVAVSWLRGNQTDWDGILMAYFDVSPSKNNFGWGTFKRLSDITGRLASSCSPPPSTPSTSSSLDLWRNFLGWWSWGSVETVAWFWAQDQNSCAFCLTKSRKAIKQSRFWHAHIGQAPFACTFDIVWLYFANMICFSQSFFWSTTGAFPPRLGICFHGHSFPCLLGLNMQLPRLLMYD